MSHFWQRNNFIILDLQEQEAFQVHRKETRPASLQFADKAKGQIDLGDRLSLQYCIEERGSHTYPNLLK